MQASFILELFKLCKENGIHTALDTSGYIFNDQAKKVLEYTDLVLLDIKHIDKDMYKKLTSVDLEPTQMAIYKWEKTNRDYKLKDVSTPTKEQIQKAEEIFKKYDLPLYKERS